jgi:uncharacterized delta-60 repeat protein
MKSPFTSLVLLIVFSVFIQAQTQTAGSLDPTFGVGGKVTTDFFGDFDRIFAVAVQPDGKIVVAGHARNGLTTDFALARYNPNGTLDTTFDGDGKVTTDFDTGGETAFALVIQPDGKIVAAGNARIGTTTNFALARYNANGSLDTTFDTDGKAATDFQNDFDQIEAIALQADGKIVAAGVSTNPNAGDDFALARYNPDGSLDSTFDGDGKVITEFNLDTDRALAVAIQTDGKIIAGGKSQTETSDDFALARYNPNGSLDTTFDGDGKVTTDFLNDVDEINAVLLQPDGKIVAAGIASLFTNGTQIDFGVARYNPDGSLDTTFDTDGKSSADFGGDFDEGFAAVLQPDGKIVVGGGARPPLMGSTVNFGLARFNPNGALDTGFDGDGKVLTHFNGLDQINALALQADGKIVAAGNTIGNNIQDFALARYLGNSASFNRRLFDYDGDGRADLSVFRPSAGSWYISHSSNNAFLAIQFGANGDLIAPADFDGDGKTDICVFRPSDGGWYRLNSSNNTFSPAQFGINGDLPVPGDFDGDGKADLTVYRPSAGSWYRINSSNNQFIAAQFGVAEDKPLVGDFDGDGKSDLTVFRPSNGTWYRINSATDSFSPAQFGAPGDLPIAADYDGDGKTDLAVYRPSVGDWYIINSSNLSFTGIHFGITEDKPAPADFDGDGKADLVVFRPSSGTWYLLRTTAGFTGIQFGATGDIPTPNAFVR